MIQRCPFLVLAPTEVQWTWLFQDVLSTTHTQRSFGTILLSFLGPASETKRLQFSLSNWHCLLSPAHREMLHGRINALGSAGSLANQSGSYSTCPRFWWNISRNDEYLLRFWFFFGNIWNFRRAKCPSTPSRTDVVAVGQNLRFSAGWCSTQWHPPSCTFIPLRGSNGLHLSGWSH